MRIGYFESLDTVPTTPAVRRAVRMAKEALEKQGYELVPFPLSKKEVLMFRKMIVVLVVNFTMGPVSLLMHGKGENLIPLY